MTDESSSPPPDEFDELLSDRSGKINDSLEQLEIKVDLWDGGDPGHFRGLVAELREDHATLLEGARMVRETAGEEWRDVVDRFMRALERLESAVATAWADFEAEAADDLDDYRSASAKQLESWRGHVDRLRLHAKLAEMDARDAVDDLERAFEAARPELEKAKQTAGEAVAAAKETSRELVAHLRQASRDASRRMD